MAYTRFIRRPCSAVSLCSSAFSSSRSALASPSVYEWCVLGAGPAGIAAVGVLLDASVPPSSLCWIDPCFSVGDFGTQWKLVSSNTTVALFKRFYNQCASFEFSQAQKKYTIDSIPEKSTCLLDIAAEPLRDITSTLRKKVSGIESCVYGIRQKNCMWECIVDSSPSSSLASILAGNVVLATGAVPRALPFHSSLPSLEVVPVAIALNPPLLTSSIKPSDTVAVFGSSHTAIIVIRTLLEQTSAQKIINFYKEPLRYALYMDSMILFDDTGLKDDTARWSREHLHGDLPEHLKRIYADDKSIAEYLPSCSKIIYATGFDRKNLPSGIKGLAPQYSYNPHCGIIAPGLFGCGIGYPEERTDKYGNVEMRVGLWDFMEYLQEVIPLWMQYSVRQGIGQPKGAPGTGEILAKL